MDLLIPLVQGIVISATPLVFAAIGELVVEKAGVINLGVEGMMIMGAVFGFIVTLESQSILFGIIAGSCAGAAGALLFGFLTQILVANQVATGLALTIFGLGLSALLGQGYSGATVQSLGSINIGYISDIPVIGPLLFSYDPLVYLSFILTLSTGWFLTKTRRGLILRAIGENHNAAHALGYKVVFIRITALLFGGASAGLGGVYLSVVQTPLWVEDMTSGRGWIALSIVVFSAWRAGYAILGAYLFGGITVVQLHIQGLGVDIDAQLLSMLPYIITILVLVMISHDKTRAKLNAPACLAKPFFVPS